MSSRPRSLCALAAAVVISAQCVMVTAPAATAAPESTRSSLTTQRKVAAEGEVQFAPSRVAEARDRQIAVSGAEHRAEDLREFTLAGLTWDASAADRVERVQMRLKEDGGWSDWEQLDVDAMPEASKTGRVGTEPLVTDGATGVEVRITTKDGASLPGARLALVHSGEAAVTTVEGTAPAPASAPSAAPAAASTVQQSDPSAAAASVQTLRPTIIPRSAWGADESITTDARTVIAPKALVLHHTASSNDYTREQSAQQVRNIHRYHAAVLGWGDIGYSFIVTKYGDIYEGRRGSIDAPVQGFHAAGMNTESIGVSALGNYETAEAPAAMRTSITRVMTWLAARHKIDPNGTTVMTSTADSSWSSSRFRYGQQVTLPTVFGHITSSATGCPGRYLIAALPTIRTQMAEALEQDEAPAPAPVPDPPAVDAPHVPHVARTTMSVNLRTFPSWKSSYLAVVPSSQTVFPTGAVRRGWHQVTVPGGRTGWISGQHLTDSRVVPSVAGLTMAVHARTTPEWGAERDGVIGASETVQLTGRVDRGWREVAHDGRLAWVSGSWLTGEHPFTHEAQALRDVTLKSGPDASYSGIGVRRSGSQFALTGRVVGSWTEVGLAGRTTWVPTTSVTAPRPID